MKRYSPTWLMCLFYVLSCLPQLMEGRGGEQNWIVTEYRPMSLAWNLKFLIDQILWALIGVFAYFTAKFPNKINKTTAKTFILWCVFDLFCYIYNYKTWGYFAMYFWLPVAWFLIYFWKSKQSEVLWQLLHEKK